MNEKPNYYAILTAEVRYDNRLNPMQKLLYAELTALSNASGFAFPSNEYLAKLYDISEITVSRNIAKLKELNYIDIIEKKTRKGTNRKIFINVNIEKTALNKNDKCALNKNDKSALNKNDKCFNTNITSKDNTTSISKESINDTNKVISTNKKYKKISLSVIKELCNSLSLKKIKPEVFYNYYSVRNFTAKDGIKITLDNLDNFLTMWDAREIETSNNKNNNANQNHQIGANENLAWMDKYYEAFGEEE